jgi:hypothetical protein
VSSTEVIRKLLSYERLPHGYGCIAIADVNDIDALSEELANIARNPGIAAAIGARGRKFALEIQRYTPTLPLLLQRVLEAAARREKMPRTVGGPARDSVTGAATEAADGRFRLTRLMLDVPRGSIADSDLDRAAIPPGPILDASAAGQILAGLKQAIDDGREALRPLAAAVRIELALAGAEDDPGEGHPTEIHDPLFRLKSLQPRRWAESDFARLVPIRDSNLRIIEFDFDVSDFLGAQTIADFPADVSPVPSYMIAFRRLHGQRREPLVVDRITARILMLSDGIRTAADIVNELEHKAEVSIEAVNLKWIENLFVCGLISLRNDADIEDI